MANIITSMLLLMLAVPLGAHAATVELPKTGVTLCYDEAGSVIPCAGTGQDGDKQAGVAWPHHRFTDNHNGTVTDNLSGLTWLKDAYCTGRLDWASAISYASKLDKTQCNLSDGSAPGDWRLPNVNELESLVDLSQVTPPLPEGHPFDNVRFDGYWTSTFIAKYPGNAECVGMDNGNVRGDVRATKYKFVWPVKGVSTKVAKSGQRTCWSASAPFDEVDCNDTGANGDKQAGVAWPNPRFVDNHNGTITDQLTLLVWLKKADCFGDTSTQSEALVAANTLANGACSLADGSVPGDWRLPNRKEMRSLPNYEQTDGGAWLTSLGFTNAQDGYYWSSDAYPGLPIDKWMVHTRGGAWLSSWVTALVPTESKYLLPVRGPMTNQTIVFDSATMTYGDSPFDLSTLAAGGGSGNPVTFTLVSGPGALSGPDNATLAITGAGDIEVRASQAGSTTFNAAVDVQQTITVNKATPSIAWASPDAIISGTALSATQLNATARVPGTFVYSPASGSVPSAGAQLLSVTFTPTNTTNYTTAHATVSLTVIRTYTITFASGGNGTISCTPSVNYGANSICTITPKGGYHLVALTDNAADRLSSVSGNSYTITGVIGNHMVTAVFAQPTGIVNAQDGKTTPNISDAFAVFKMVLGITNPTAADIAHADVAPLGSDGKPFGDSHLDIYDVIGILRMSIGL